MKTKKVNQFDEINITPLTDIFLVLLIIMMVVAPIINTGGVTLGVTTASESADESPSDEEAKQMQVKIESGGADATVGRFFVENEQVSAEELQAAMRARAAEFPDGVVLEIAADSRHEDMTRAIVAAQGAGIAKVMLNEVAAAEAGAEE